jgi:hypothetical protein
MQDAGTDCAEVGFAFNTDVVTALLRDESASTASCAGTGA